MTDKKQWVGHIEGTTEQQIREQVANHLRLAMEDLALDLNDIESALVIRQLIKKVTKG